MSNIEDEPKKILIAGLPGVGLKTIKAVVVDNNPPPELKAVHEKLDIDDTFRDILQRRALLIRCGGEKSIQDILSRDHDPIYKNVDALVYVLDIGENSTLSIGKYWFDALNKHLHKHSPDARIFLLLHKVDLLAENKSAPAYIRAARNLFSTKQQEIFIHETSIYDASIYYAFKDVLRKEKDNQISVKQYLNQIIPESSFMGIAVFSKDGLPIYEAGTIPAVVTTTTNVLLSSVSRIAQELDKDDEVSSTILQMKKNSFMIFKMINNTSVFIGISKQRPRLGQMLVETDQIVEMLKKGIT